MAPAPDRARAHASLRRGEVGTPWTFAAVRPSRIEGPKGPLEPVRDGFRRFAIHALATSTEVVATSLGERAEVLGALAIARDALRAPVLA